MTPRGRDMWIAESDRDCNPYCEEPAPTPRYRTPAIPAPCLCCGGHTYAFILCPRCEGARCNTTPRCGRKE